MMTDGLVSPLVAVGSTLTEKAKRMAAKFDVIGAIISIGSPAMSVCTATAGLRPLCSRPLLAGKLTSSTSPRAI
ncbi:MAG: hypothetical protein R2911_25380 [Caldilineaceae bacterium]